MRINMSMERYDIQALDEIYKIADDLNKKSQILETLGVVIKQKLIASSDEFTTINYSRIEEASNSYLKKMKLMLSLIHI